MHAKILFSTRVCRLPKLKKHDIMLYSPLLLYGQLQYVAKVWFESEPFATPIRENRWEKTVCFVPERDRSSTWLERLPVKEEVEGSNPFGPA